MSFKWIWNDIPHWIGVHWVRHKWECFVRTQREDRAGIPREKLSQTEPQNFTGEANIQNLIDTMRKRLCYQASPETRQYAEDLKMAVHDKDEYVADVLVPNCIYRCGCPELSGCNFFNKLVNENAKFKDTNIQTRYDTYNEWFYKNKDETNV